MDDTGSILRLALDLIVGADAALVEIVELSLRVSLGAVAIACTLGFPLGAAVGSARFPGRGAVIVLLNTLMGLPPVVVGLLLIGIAILVNLCVMGLRRIGGVAAGG